MLEKQSQEMKKKWEVHLVQIEGKRLEVAC